MYRARWGLSFWGWAVLLAMLLFLSFLFGRYAHGYLAPKALLGGEVLVVSGWLPAEALQDVVRLYRQGHYRYVIPAGGPIRQFAYLANYPTSADATAEGLRRLGIPEHAILVAASPAVRRDRTFTDALQVRKVIKQHHVQLQAIDILSEGPHARRTRLLYRMAFADLPIRIGVFARDSGAYDPQAWWRSSAGVRVMIDEAVAWLYARFVFAPSHQIGAL